MRQPVTVSLPPRLKKELDQIAAREGLSRSDVMRESLEDYLFFRRFRTLRRRLMAKDRAHGISDEDVFDRVS